MQTGQKHETIQSQKKSESMEAFWKFKRVGTHLLRRTKPLLYVVRNSKILDSRSGAQQENNTRSLIYLDNVHHDHHWGHDDRRGNKFATITVNGCRGKSRGMRKSRRGVPTFMFMKWLSRPRINRTSISQMTVGYLYLHAVNLRVKRWKSSSSLSSPRGNMTVRQSDCRYTVQIHKWHLGSVSYQLLRSPYYFSLKNSPPLAHGESRKD